VLADKGDVSLAFWWAHLRRRFYERPVAEASPIADEALQRIAALYRMDTDIRGRGPDKRRAVRQERSRPLLAELEPGCAKSSPSSAGRVSSPRRSAMRSRIGMVLPDSSTTAGSRSTQALQRIAALYRMETDIRGRGPDKRHVVRQERLRPLLAELEPWLREKLTLCQPEE
jgi:hypothetical protein